MENHIDAYLLVRTTFHGRSSSIRLEGYSGSTLRIWRRYSSGSMSFRRQVPISPYNSALRSPSKNIKFLFPRQMAQRAFSAALCLPPPDRQHCNNRVRPTDSVHSWTFSQSGFLDSVAFFSTIHACSESSNSLLFLCLTTRCSGSGILDLATWA